jgi:dTDP-4-dehydrorhamnose 3,5-epimerase
MKKPKLFKSKMHKDKRGNLNEILNKHFKKKFKFILQTTSKKNVFRGFHFQRKFQQTKHLHLMKGEILDITIDLKKKSKNFGKIYKFKLKAGYSLYIPKGFAHGYYTYGKENILLYIMDSFRKKKYEDGINVKDQIFNFLNKKKMIISDKDKNWNELSYFKKKYKGL